MRASADSLSKQTAAAVQGFSVWGNPNTAVLTAISTGVGSQRQTDTRDRAVSVVLQGQRVPAGGSAESIQIFAIPVQERNPSLPVWVCCVVERLYWCYGLLSAPVCGAAHAATPTARCSMSTIRPVWPLFLCVWGFLCFLGTIIDKWKLLQRLKECTGEGGCNMQPAVWPSRAATSGSLGTHGQVIQRGFI